MRRSVLLAAVVVVLVAGAAVVAVSVGVFGSGTGSELQSTPSPSPSTETPTPAPTATPSPTPAPDTDGDGLADGLEREVGTDPTVADTDGDGLDDGRERELGTDPTVADTDSDGLEDGSEVAEYGTDPAVADTDGDGLDDGRERELGTDPTVADTDDDGLSDAAELRHGTDPAVADTDDDRLDDGRELSVGTDPTVPDTDNDKLGDGAEVRNETGAGAPLPGADPLRKDLYVHVSVSNGSDPFTSGELDDIEAAWADMPVGNPDNSTGIDIHLTQATLETEEVIDGPGDYGALQRAYGSESFLGNRSGSYHHLMLVEIELNYLGQGAAPGTFSVVAAGDRETYDGMSGRATTAVHELLHNVVGRLTYQNQCPEEFDGESAEYHTCQGWLSYDSPAESQFLPKTVARELEAGGLLKEETGETATRPVGPAVARP